MQLSICSHQTFRICRTCLLQCSYLQTATSMNALRLSIPSNMPLSSAELNKSRVIYTGRSADAGDDTFWATHCSAEV